MLIPREIVEKMELVNKLMLQIDRWMFENIETVGSKHNCSEYFTGNFKHSDYYDFSKDACGEYQGDCEYCSQRSIGESGDCFEGEYYYPTEKGNFFWFHYSL